VSGGGNAVTANGDPDYAQRLKDQATFVGKQALIAGAIAFVDQAAAAQYFSAALGQEVGSRLGDSFNAGFAAGFKRGQDRADEAQRARVQSAAARGVGSLPRGPQRRRPVQEAPQPATAGTMLDRDQLESQWLAENQERLDRSVDQLGQELANTPITISHKLDAGETLWGLAKDDLGPGASDADIQQRVYQYLAANDIDDPRRLRAGTEIIVPNESQVVSRTAVDVYMRSDAELQEYRAQIAQVTAQSDAAQTGGNFGQASGWPPQFEFDPEYVARSMAAVAESQQHQVRIVGGRDIGPLGLTEEHADIMVLAKNYPPAPGTKQWDTFDSAGYAVGKNIFPFKDQWVAGYRDAIRAAAARYDLPPELVAGTAYNEVGGDPLWIDNAAYEARKDLPFMSKIMPKTFKDPAKTSFGNVSVQVSTAADALGYKGSLTDEQRDRIVTSLEDPVQNIFIAAKYLSDLRDRDFKGVSAPQLTMDQIEVIGKRYNAGAGPSIEKIRANLDYGKTITKRWDHLAELLQISVDQPQKPKGK